MRVVAKNNLLRLNIIKVDLLYGFLKHKDLFNRCVFCMFILPFIVLSVYGTSNEEYEDSLILWKNVRYSNYCDSTDIYNVFFNLLKVDFDTSGLDLFNEADRHKIEIYIEIRNDWMTEKNINNFLMAMVLTRQMNALISDQIDDYIYFQKRIAIKSLNRQIVEEICLSKNRVFNALDEILISIDDKWKPLVQYEKEFGEEDGWLKYISQCGLKYVPHGVGEILATGEDEDHFFKIHCASAHLVELKREEIIQRCSYIVDLGEKFNLAYMYIKNVQGDHTKEKANYFFKNNVPDFAKRWIYIRIDNPKYFYILPFMDLSALKDGMPGWLCPYDTVDCSNKK